MSRLGHRLLVEMGFAADEDAPDGASPGSIRSGQVAGGLAANDDAADGAASTHPPLRRWQLITGWTLGAGALGVLGTFSYNTSITLAAWQDIPVGLVFCILALAAYAFLARLTAGFAGIAVTTLALFVISEALTLRGPGGDVLVPAAHASSYIWLIAAIAIPLAVAFLPRRWFPAASPQPVPPNQPFADQPDFVSLPNCLPNSGLADYPE